MHSVDVLYTWIEGESSFEVHGNWSNMRQSKVPIWVYDTNDTPEKTYGKFIPGKGWADSTFEEFPAHFKALLMLHGVTFK